MGFTKQNQTTKGKVQERWRRFKQQELGLIEFEGDLLHIQNDASMARLINNMRELGLSKQQTWDSNIIYRNRKKLWINQENTSLKQERLRLNMTSPISPTKNGKLTRPSNILVRPTKTGSVGYHEETGKYVSMKYWWEPEDNERVPYHVFPVGVVSRND